MPVLVMSDLPGTTLDAYNHLAAVLVPKMEVHDGFIAHAAGPIDGGFRVVELWESEDAHHAWFTGHVLPTLPPGVPAPTVAVQPIARVAIRA